MKYQVWDVLRDYDGEIRTIVSIDGIWYHFDRGVEWCDEEIVEWELVGGPSHLAVKQPTNEMATVIDRLDKILDALTALEAGEEGSATKVQRAEEMTERLPVFEVGETEDPKLTPASHTTYHAAYKGD